MPFTGYYPGANQKLAAREYLDERARAEAMARKKLADSRLERSRRWLDLYMARRNASRPPQGTLKVTMPVTATTEVINGEWKVESEARYARPRSDAQGVGNAQAQREEGKAKTGFLESDGTGCAVTDGRAYDPPAPSSKEIQGERWSVAEPFSADDPLPF